MKLLKALLLAALVALAGPPALAQTAGNNSILAVNGSSTAGAAPFAGGLHAICVVDGAGLCRGPLSDAAGVLTVGIRPPGTAITCDTGVKANATGTCTLAGAASKTTYITGFTCTGAGATAALVTTLTLTGVITATMNFTLVFPAGVTTPITGFPPVTFPIPIPASATNTAIVVNLPASGAGGTNVNCNAEGFQL